MKLLPRPLRGRDLLAIGAVAALAVTGVTAAPAVTALAAPGCAVTYTTNTWQNGFTANITIKNLGDPVDGWTLGFTFPDPGQKVTHGWSATYGQTGPAVTARSAGHNDRLGTGATTTIGFNGSHTGANPAPASFTLNGVTCTGAVVPTPTPTTTPTPGGTPVGINGRLRVCGVHLCNQYGRPVQLRGMSSHGLQWFADCYDEASLDALAHDWKADLFRISMYVQEGGYETDPARFTREVNRLVDMAEARGMYAVVDFHTLTPGDPTYNLDRAKTFFAAVSARNAAKDNVIYEIANEPNGVSWATIRSYAEQVIPVIRANDPDAVVIVGTRAWSSLGVSEGGNENEVVANPVNAANVMYAFHFYAASHTDSYRQTVARAATRLPLFVSEFGTVTYTGGGQLDLASTTAWLDLLDQHRISYANWTYSDAPESSAAFRPGTCGGGVYAGTGVLNESGVYLRARIRTPDDFPTG
ncbi:cellulase family glycosylhydrolase [Nonomuraea indica]|uniref:cellulase family glycosylhydrolase n=1 Tax=Nonomuraea indica TaxID=1581193 RepID=UPI000C7DABD3|nr:cellulase family glycosylhydrolase [Nonomuraea indica]